MIKIVNEKFKTRFPGAYEGIPSMFKVLEENTVQIRPFMEERILDDIQKYETALQWLEDVDKKLVMTRKDESDLNELRIKVQNIKPKGKWPERPDPYKGILHHSKNPPVKSGWVGNTYFGCGDEVFLLEKLKVLRVNAYWLGEYQRQMPVVEFEVFKGYKQIVNRYLETQNTFKDIQLQLGNHIRERDSAQFDCTRYKTGLKG